jgi:hypothetical protein
LKPPATFLIDTARSGVGIFSNKRPRNINDRVEFEGLEEVME